jgi:hypothetical protein
LIINFYLKITYTLAVSFSGNGDAVSFAVVRNLTGGLITPGMDAVILVIPVPTPIAKPFDDRVAII